MRQNTMEQSMLLQVLLAQIVLLQMTTMCCAGHLRSPYSTARELFFVSTSSSDSCETVSGPQSRSACVFPFKFRGVTYDGCTEVASEGTPWCSTKTDSNGVHVQGNWGSCPSSCKMSLDGTPDTQSTSTPAALYSNPNPIPGVSRWAFSEVPYVLPVNAFESIGEKVSRRRIEFAMAHYRRHTALRFVERTSQRNYVRFVWGDSCSSWVGAQGGEQVVTLM